MGVVMGITASILGIAAGLVGLVIWAALLFPQPTERAGMALERRPGRCFLVGLVLAGAIGLPAVVMLNAAHGLAKLAGWGLLMALAVVLVVGFAAMARLLGERLRGLSPGMTPLGGLVRGAVTVELALLPPFLGWFVFAPLVGITMVGAGTMGCVRRRSMEARDWQAEELRSVIAAAQPEPTVATTEAVALPAEARTTGVMVEGQGHVHAA